ncbi:hypothetical protein K1719_000946 [Acacia pycnantha]|nr:hypothetical protein K1719_000946 [Acacia pycnantha]
MCERCNSYIEDDLHVIRDCGAIRNFWASIIHSKHHSRFLSGTIDDWMKLNLPQNIRLEKGRLKSLFIIIYWLLWRDKNEWVHLRISIGIDQVYPRTSIILESTTNATTKLCSVNLSINMRPTGSLEAESPASVIGIEVDGAFSHTHRKAACGGIINDTKGVVIEGFCLHLENGDSLTVELWGCL